MSNFDDFVKILDNYLILHGFPTEIRSNMQSTSYSSADQVSLVNSLIPVIDMDAFAKKSYRKIILPDSVTEDDSINTADAFLINRLNEWYFVEFKDAKVSKSKASVLKKAYSNVYAILDVIYTMKKVGAEYSGFDYDNPIAFFRENVRYILVFRASKNPEHVLQLKNHRLKKEKYLPEFMKRLEGYIFKEAYAVTEEVFENIFVKSFVY